MNEWWRTFFDQDYTISSRGAGCWMRHVGGEGSPARWQCLEQPSLAWTSRKRCWRRQERSAVRPGGRVVVETNHRDLMCAFIAHGSKASKRMPDGTLFVDEPEFDAISGVVRLNFYWSGPMGSGEKHAEWRCYTPTEIVGLLERAGLRLAKAYQGLSKTPYKAEGPEVGGRLTVVAVREG